MVEHRKELNKGNAYTQFYGSKNNRGRNSMNQYSLDPNVYSISKGDAKVGTISSKKIRNEEYQNANNFYNKYGVKVLH